ncbi:hypothetical protein GH733_007271 [Mirounga leonina]|nr:hypothetical protein GH733_007271 [Mirounga leonina]
MATVALRPEGVTIDELLKVMVHAALPSTTAMPYSFFLSGKKPNLWAAWAPATVPLSPQEPPTPEILVVPPTRSRVFCCFSLVWTGFEEMRNRSSCNMAVRDLVRSIFLCNMRPFHAHLRGAATCQTCPSAAPTARLQRLPRGAVSSKAPYQPPLERRPFGLAQEACRSYRHVVLNKVHFFNLQGLSRCSAIPSLTDEPCLGRAALRTPLARDDSILLGTSGTRVEADPCLRVVREVCAAKPELKVLPFLSFTLQLEAWIHNITYGYGRGMQLEAKTASRHSLNISQVWPHALLFAKVHRVPKLCPGA